MKDYLASASACKTKNEFNRLHIDLEVELSPLEITGLLARAEGDEREGFPQNSVKWLRTTRSLYPEVFAQPERYRRDRLSERVVRYEDPDIPRNRKRVLIAFAGAANRMGLPIAPFLQCFPSADWSVVLVNKERGRPFRHGWKDGPNTFPGVVDVVRQLADTEEYAGIATVGSSSGGLPAILCACVVGAGAGLALSGRFGEDSRDHVMNILQRRIGEPRLTYAYGAEHGPDRQDAARMRSVFGAGEMKPIEGCEQHNVAGYLQAAGLLRALLFDTLISPAGTTTSDTNGYFDRAS